MNADVPWAMAGPSGADPTVRHYSHDAWNSVAATINLPAKGAVMGALAPVLTPGEAGERRSFLVAYPILHQTAADRRTANSEWAADLGEGLRAQSQDQATRPQPRRDRQGPRRGRQARPRQRPDPPVRGVHRHRPQDRPDRRVRPPAGRRRSAAPGSPRCGWTWPTTSAFAASTVPLGVSLTRRGAA